MRGRTALVETISARLYVPTQAPTIGIRVLNQLHPREMEHLDKFSSALSAKRRPTMIDVHRAQR